MDAFPKTLDFLTTRWATYPRRFPSALPLAVANFAEEKDHRILRGFATCNFSIILRGRGDYRLRGRVWEVSAPCVLTQWPGETFDYGPPLPAETWDELYLIYPGSLLSRFRASRLIDPERPVWSVARPEALHAQVAEFAALARHPRPEAVVDQVDRVAERMVLETLLPADETEATDSVIATIAKAISQPRRLAQAVDFGELAARHGLSATTFRRRWAEAMGGVPPAKYVQTLRLREACRLLEDTARPIHEIAASVGFADEFYFSRRFHRALGMAPREYRRIHRPRAGGRPSA